MNEPAVNSTARASDSATRAQRRPGRSLLTAGYRFRAAADRGLRQDGVPPAAYCLVAQHGQLRASYMELYAAGTGRVSPRSVDVGRAQAGLVPPRHPASRRPRWRMAA